MDTPSRVTMGAPVNVPLRGRQVAASSIENTMRSPMASTSRPTGADILQRRCCFIAVDMALGVCCMVQT